MPEGVCFYISGAITFNSRLLECSCVTGGFSMLLKVAFKSTMELDMFIGQLQKFGRTSTQIVFSTHVGPRGVDVDEI